MFAEQDFNCRCFEENKTGKIAHDLSEISYDTSANWTETLAKPPKPLANWSSVKRLLGETTGIPTVFSRAFNRFFNEMVVFIKEIATSDPILFDSNILVASIDDRVNDRM